MYIIRVRVGWPESSRQSREAWRFVRRSEYGIRWSQRTWRWGYCPLRSGVTPLAARSICGRASPG